MWFGSSRLFCGRFRAPLLLYSAVKCFVQLELCTDSAFDARGLAQVKFYTRPTAPTTALSHQSSAHTMESEARYMRRKVKAGLIEADHNEVRTHSFSGPPQHFFLAFRSLT